MLPNRGRPSKSNTFRGSTPEPLYSTQMAKVSPQWLSSIVSTRSRGLGQSLSRTYFIQYLLAKPRFCAFCFCLSCSVSTIRYIINGTMEYDEATGSTPLPPAKPDGSTSTKLLGRGHLRVKGDGNVDTNCSANRSRSRFLAAQPRATLSTWFLVTH
jgi:hypothetical protein